VRKPPVHLAGFGESRCAGSSSRPAAGLVPFDPVRFYALEHWGKPESDAGDFRVVRRLRLREDSGMATPHSSTGRNHRAGQRIAAVSAVVALACAVPAGASAAPAAGPSAGPARLSLPAPTGPNRVGAVELHLIDRSRPDPWQNLPASVRTDAIGTIDPAEAIRTQETYVAAFFDRWLRGRDGRLLDGPSPDYPAMEFVK
jgi:hypothetical protein